MRKDLLLTALRDRLDSQLRDLTAAQNSAQAGAFHPENKQEHSKDTRAIEAAYLARGLAERVETLRDGIAALSILKLRDFGEDDPASVGALVRVLDGDDRESAYFLAPAGGGEKLAFDGGKVFVLTPQSPLGAAICGKREGDAVEVELPSGKLLGEITSVR